MADTSETHPRVYRSIEELEQAVGSTLGRSGWYVVDQERVDAFADATGDHQWIHVDPHRAAASPFGGTIAHGYLTLSMLPMLAAEIYRVEGVGTALNYGLDKVRFPAPLPVGARIRATAELVSATPVSQDGMQFVVRFTVEAEGYERPVCVADTIRRLIP
ncbi:MaoC family dehydratase [Ornithinimicrobium panacihumi]|uniref:MaoC family dehydratase n=1 Tax=Ornithinimicrobium panacihumi TaxID=2008449 RepID=UPI003F8BD61B